MKRLAILGLAVIAAVAIVGFFWHGDDEGARGPGVSGSREQVKRGEYLARAGNCRACHTARGGEAYAGGVPIATPFGVVFSSNITRDPDTGLGAWSADDFWSALHKGKSRDGSYLYPAFPFPNYTRVTREDSDAIYAYLRTVPPVRRTTRPPELRYPYNQRRLMAVWRLLYFRPGVHRDDPKQSPAWNRGAYLVQGLGHCSACHASRNVLGAVTGEDFSGALLPAQSWYAPALSSERETSLGRWPLEELVAFLTTGVSERAAAYGPMSSVIRHSLQYLTRSDAEAMAAYLKSQVHITPARSVPPVRPSPAQVERLLEHGAHVYERHCVECHRANGEGVPRMYPALAGNTSILMDLAVNPIRIVYAGGFPPSTAGNPRPFGMPPFYQDLSDYDVAAVVTYIRRSWGNDASPVSQAQAAALRGIPGD
jgi:mono/diheme cytochrome c family protein